MSRRPARAGLFHGVWTDLEGRKIRRVHRSEYGDLYRLWRKHTDIRLGVMPFGMRGALNEGGVPFLRETTSSAPPSLSAYRHGNLNGDAA